MTQPIKCYSLKKYKNFLAILHRKKSLLMAISTAHFHQMTKMEGIPPQKKGTGHKRN